MTKARNCFQEVDSSDKSGEDEPSFSFTMPITSTLAIHECPVSYITDRSRWFLWAFWKCHEIRGGFSQGEVVKTNGYRAESVEGEYFLLVIVFSIIKPIVAELLSEQAEKGRKERKEMKETTSIEGPQASKMHPPRM